MTALSPPQKGRPLKVMSLVVAMWVTGRIVAHLPVTKEDLSPQSFASAAEPRFAPSRRFSMPLPVVDADVAQSPNRPAAILQASILPPRPIGDFAISTVAKNGTAVGVSPQSNLAVKTSVGSAAATSRVLAPFPTQASASPHPDGWIAAAWILWRESGGGGTLASQGRLGGSQAGVRVDRHLASAPIGRVYAYARASAALERPHDGELAVGAVLRPKLPLPVSIGIERRIALASGGRNAFAIIGTTGIGPIAIAHALMLEGYGQAGMVGLRRRDGFVDGRLTLTHALPLRNMAAGMSVSGGAQPGIRRLDIGPVIDVRLTAFRPAPRLSLEWRQRIAGNARPGSGAAITLGADF